jgi:predicted MFS family arabinose efflux permease
LPEPCRPGAREALAAVPIILNLIALTTFAANLSVRSIDPVLPSVASDLSVSAAQAASLSAGLAFTFAIVQPVIGAAADLFGKARLIVLCLVLLGTGSILGAFATSFPVLLTTRILCGIGAGGVFPVALGLTSDFMPLAERQVALSRVLAGALIGNILGAALAGVIGDIMGWRGVLLLLGVLTLVAAGAAGFGLRGRTINRVDSPASLATLAHGYRVLFANPRTKTCYTVVFFEGCCVLGVLPFVAAFLVDLGETRLSIAGTVIAGFAAGGLVYTAWIEWLLPRLGMRRLMIGGAALAGLQLILLGAGLSWQAQAASFVVLGLGFYMLHGCMQVFASELSNEARATSLSLHACFFFLGQTAGPIAYGFGLDHFGKMPTLIISAGAMMLVGLSGALLLAKRS